jgi:hypothetical protein
MADFKSANGFAPTGGAGGAVVSYTQNFPLAQAGVVLIGTLTATGTTAASAAANPFGSSLSLQRLYLPGVMSLTEVDLAFGVSFPATNQGQGSLSQSFIIYSFGNSTSLASVLSASRAVSWASGTTTAGTSSSLQQGWSGPNIQPFTFASTSLAAGNYAVAHLLSWAAESTSWFVSVYGGPGLISATQSAVTNLTSATLGAASSFATGSSVLTVFTAAPTGVNAMSSAGLNAGSVHTASASSAITAFTAAPTAANVLSSAGFAAASGITGALGVASYAGAFLALSTAGSQTGFTMSAPASAAASSQNTVVSVSVTNSAKSALFQLIGNAANSNIVSAVTLGGLAGSIHTGSTSTAVIANAGTAVASLLASQGLSAGSFFTASGSGAVISNAGTAVASLAGSFTTASFGAVTAAGVATGSVTVTRTTAPTFGYNGSLAMTTATADATFQAIFNAGIMATGSAPTAIDLKSTAVKLTGSVALIQPWFALVGA